MPHNTAQLDPSLQAGAVLPGREELLHSAMAEVVPMFATGEVEAAEAVHDYVNRRVSELSPTDDGTAVSVLRGGKSAFIAPETEMIMSALFSKPYFLDDNGAYEVAFPYIQSYYEDLQAKLPPDRAYMNAIINGINYGQMRYFGSITGDPRRRLEVAADFILDEGEEEKPVS